MSSATTTPHAYAVEMLVNPGSRREYWQLDSENPPRATLDEARCDLEDAVEEGHSADWVRLVALTVVD